MAWCASLRRSKSPSVRHPPSTPCTNSSCPSQFQALLPCRLSKPAIREIAAGFCLQADHVPSSDNVQVIKTATNCSRIDYTHQSRHVVAWPRSAKGHFVPVKLAIHAVLSHVAPPCPTSAAEAPKAKFPIAGKSMPDIPPRRSRVYRNKDRRKSCK